MASTIILKNSNTSGAVPAANALQVGEVAVNTADGTFFTKHTDGAVKTISGGGGAGTVVSVASTLGSAVSQNANFTVAMTGTSALVGGSVASFEITDWNGAKSTVAATANAGSKQYTAPATVGQVLSFDIVAIDNYGNKSAKLTKTTTVAANAAPTGTPVISTATSVIQGSTGNQLVISAGTVTDADGDAITYKITQSGSNQFTFSKTSGIAAGETVTFTAPALGAQADVSFNVIPVDSKGAEGSATVKTVSVILANIIGVVCKTTGGNGGTWSHIDKDGVDLTTQWTAANFNGHSVFGGMVDHTIDGQAMVKVPKFYYKRGVVSGGVNNGKDAWWISDAPVAGYSVHPAFMHNGSEIAQFYYGKYQARLDGTKMTSLSGGLPQVSRTPVQFAADAAARNTGGVTGFMMHSFWQLSAIQMLYLVENKSMNSQATTGSGVTGALGNVQNGSANYRNIIGLWENAAQWLDGFKTLNGDIKTWDINGNKTWVSQGAAPFVDGSWHYPLTFKTNNNLGAAFVAATDTTTSTAGTSADGQLFFNGTTTTEYIPFVGGNFSHGANAGLWCMGCSIDASTSVSLFGSRLAKV